MPETSRKGTMVTALSIRRLWIRVLSCVNWGRPETVTTRSALNPKTRSAVSRLSRRVLGVASGWSGMHGQAPTGHWPRLLDARWIDGPGMLKILDFGRAGAGLAANAC
tara:strand:- start:394 stop:717 length:324 start_codon:yes stop_codon:yes gene_type:complete